MIQFNSIQQALNLTLSPFWNSNPRKLLKYIHILLNYMYIMSQMISLGFCYNTFVCGWKFLILWQEDLIEQNCSRMFAYRVDFMGWFHSKVAYHKCVFFTQIGNDYSFKIKHRLRIKYTYVEDFFEKMPNWSSCKLQLKAYYISLHTNIKASFYTSWNTKWLKRYIFTVLYLSFQFHNNSFITIRRS